MTRQDLQATYDAADERVHQARQALQGAILERSKVKSAIAQTRVPEDVRAYMERMDAAYALTPEEQAEREAAQERFDAMAARRAEILKQLARVEAGQDPKPKTPGPGLSLSKMAAAMSQAVGRESRIKAAKEALSEELRELNGTTDRPGPLTRALRDLNATIRRTDSARRARRMAAKADFAQARHTRGERQNSYPSRPGAATFTSRRIIDGKEVK